MRKCFICQTGVRCLKYLHCFKMSSVSSRCMRACVFACLLTRFYCVHNLHCCGYITRRYLGYLRRFTIVFSAVECCISGTCHLVNGNTDTLTTQSSIYSPTMVTTLELWDLIYWIRCVVVLVDIYSHGSGESKEGARDSPRPKILHFRKKSGQIIGWRPLRGWRPPRLGNPGSTTARGYEVQL